jgi:hypothetical protein
LKRGNAADAFVGTQRIRALTVWQSLLKQLLWKSLDEDMYQTRKGQ